MQRAWLRIVAAASVVAILGLLLVVPGRRVAADDTCVVLTPHYELHAVASQEQAEEWARVLEAAWPQYERFFGAVPELADGERLQVRIAASEPGFAAALAAEGAAAPDAGGVYVWATRTAFLYVQPTRHNTRQLLLHECAHQFHYLARTGNERPVEGWYVEGIAEYLSRHDWDGQSVALGLVPVVSLADTPKDALEELSDPDFPFRAVLLGQRDASRPVAWAITAFLAQGDADARRRCEVLRDRLDRGTSMAQAIAQGYGEQGVRKADVVAWLRTSQEPFAQIFLEWEGASRTSVRGTADVVSTCRIRGPARALHATVECGPAGAAFKAGMLLSQAPERGYVVALVTRDGVVTVNRRKDGAWHGLFDGNVVVPPDGVYRFVARRADERVAFEVNGQEFGPWQLPGDALGLAVEDCSVRFRDLSWE